MKQVVCQCCGETLQISGRLSAFVPDSITCAQCVVDPSRGHPVKVASQDQTMASSQCSALKPQPPSMAWEWMKRPLRKIFAGGDGA